MSSFVSRLAVTLAGLPVVLAAAWIGGWLFFGLVAIAAVTALHELYRLARELRPLVLAGYAPALGVLAAAELGEPVWMLGAFLAAFLLVFAFAAVAETRQSTTVAIGTTVLGAAWIGFGLGCLILIREAPVAEDDGRQFVFTVLLTVFVTDTFAYLGGRVAGRHKMTPVMSPGKTWEGLLFGAVAGVFATWVSVYETGYLESWRAFLLAGVLVVAATMGDLFESLVKRDLGAKDTGRLLAGHGGMLDRIDSLLFAAPAAFFTLLGLGEL
jgi:phosphatidate cytidylyltransferase